MKIYILIKELRSWYSKELRREAKKKKLDVEFIKIENLNNFNKINKIKKGDIVFWRSAEIDRYWGKNTTLKIIEERGAKIINPTYLIRPFITHKFYQQNILKNEGIVETIPTFIFSNKKELKTFLSKKHLKFPFIGKPNLGSKGDGIFLFKNEQDISKFSGDVRNYIFQNYLENDGDYRVLILGGKTLGIIKRKAGRGSFLNNVSKGGKTESVKQGDFFVKLSSVAEKIATKLDLSFCGVDLIIDKKTKKLYFLELNTAAQWRGFQEETGINVAKEVVNYLDSLLRRNSKVEDVYSFVHEYYEKNYSKLLDKKFHYASRLYLWSNKKNLINEINNLKDGYLEGDTGVYNVIKNKLLSKTSDYQINFYEKREKLFKKYPNLFPYSKVLFFYLFSKTIYNKNFKKDVLSILDKEEMIKLADKLHANNDDLFLLSTYAINYIYLLEDLTGNKITHPEIYLKILNQLDQRKEVKDDGEILMAIYLATHSIIGESRFYSRKISKNKKVYVEILKRAEKIILDNFLKVNLDCKLEFIVCCRLLNYDSFLECAIKQEVDTSLSPLGNYLIDTYNLDKNRNKKLSFRDSEHRNVLYLMAFNKKYEK